MQIDQRNNQFILYNIRELLSIIDEKTNKQILAYVQFLSWNKKYRFCSKCKSKLNLVNDIIEKKCICCNLSFFPKLSPAVIVLIQRDDKILLARSKNFRQGVYGLIAGFIEIGEDAESAVHREVKEEIGIDIHRLEYFGTQSWTFPSSFMVAYKAHYLDGELIIDKNEIEDAKWFNKDNLPKLPYESSIARKLINDFIFNI